MLKMNLQIFAHKKGVGSTKNGRDSEAKRLGAKRADGQFVKAGNRCVIFQNIKNKTFLNSLSHGVNMVRMISAVFIFPAVFLRKGKSV
mgnify:CR=1 FL=1